MGQPLFCWKPAHQQAWVNEMEELAPGVQLLIGLLCFIGPLAMGWMIGASVERRHFANLDAREDRIRATMIVTQNRELFAPLEGKQAPRMLMAETAIATDYMKTYLAGWRGFFGGEVRSYRTLLERARREATLRMVEEAQRMGYNAVGNIRLDPCEIGGAGATAIIVATATAYHSGILVKDDFADGTSAPSRPPVETGNPYQATESEAKTKAEPPEDHSTP